MADTKSIVVLGSLNMDLVMVTSRMPAAGETMHGTSFASHPGGKGLNQAVACQRLLQGTGWKTCMVGRTGDDEFSGKLKLSLESEGVNVSEVKTVTGKASGVALILVCWKSIASLTWQVEENSGQNRIILSANDANSSLQPENVDAMAPMIRSAAMLICQLETPLQTVERALSIAHNAGVITVLNPAPALPDIPQSLYETVDYLIPNETEAEILIGGNFRVNDISTALDGALELMRRGVRKAVIITLGEHGIVIAKHDGQTRTFPARAVPKVVDTTGAGDCFIGAFAVGLAEMGLQVEGAANFGLVAAAFAIQKKGARDSMPFRNEMGMGWSLK
jgi:ribokinase